jgi:hypothetical protein
MNVSQLYLNAFNDKYEEFVNSIVEMFPKDADVLATKTIFCLMRKSNPKLLIKAWENYVQRKYTNEINAGDIRFFIDKDYHSDLSENPDSDYVISVINRLREPINSLSTEQFDIVLKYLQQLNNLCATFFLLKIRQKSATIS